VLVRSEAYLRRQGDPGKLRLAVTIDGSLWRGVAGVESAGPSDPVYVAERGAEGSLILRFGDGQHGRRPPPGARVTVIDREGADGTGDGSADPCRTQEARPRGLPTSPSGVATNRPCS
jgi:hypothetical protein